MPLICGRAQSMTMTAGGVARELNGFEAVTGFAYDVERRFVFEDAAKTAADEGVVVNEEDGEFYSAWGSTCSRGTCR